MNGSVSNPSSLIGFLSENTNALTGSLSQPESISGTLNLPTIISPEVYDGSYEVIPEAHNEQILSTAHKLLTADVSVKEIPYYETTNPGGGYTVIIG